MRTWKCARCGAEFQADGVFDKPYCKKCHTTLFVYEKCDHIFERVEETNGCRFWRCVKCGYQLANLFEPESE